MTATCREACCNVTPRLTVAELFERGHRRNREAPLSIEGQACGDDGHVARFSLDMDGGRIAAVGFRATTCATLLSYCEYLAEVMPGRDPDIARMLTPHDLIEALPGVPALKRHRAALAIAAFRAALAAAEAQTSQGGEPA